MSKSHLKSQENFKFSCLNTSRAYVTQFDPKLAENWPRTLFQLAVFWAVFYKLGWFFRNFIKFHRFFIPLLETTKTVFQNWRKIIFWWTTFLFFAEVSPFPFPLLPQNNRAYVWFILAMCYKIIGCYRYIFNKCVFNFTPSEIRYEICHLNYS